MLETGTYSFKIYFVTLMLSKNFLAGKPVVGISDPWYGSARHYWSLNNVQEGRVKDINGNRFSEVYSVELINGYNRKGLQITNKAGSGIRLIDVQDTCLGNPDICDEGFTIIFWLKLKTLKYSNIHHTIIQSSRRSFSVGTALLFKNKVLSFYVNSPNRTRQLNVRWKTFEWTHISLVWNKTAGQSNMYFNCTPLLNATRLLSMSRFGPAVPTSGKLTVGANHMLMHNTPDMMIDEIAIWYRPLLLEEISSIYLAKSVDGGYSTWSNYSTCTVSCGNGISNRTRTCTNPHPQHGGLECSGPSQETIACNTHPCPIDGGYSPWTDFTSCSLTCGGGVRRRTRSCTNPPARYGGKSCSGASLVEEMCNLHPCPVEGGYTEWSTFSPCSVTCGNGTTKRHRSCTNPSPQHGGRNCTHIGVAVDKKSCFNKECPIDGNYSNWSKFGVCSVSCGGGTQIRHRLCNNPAPRAGGRNCSHLGAAEHKRDCKMQNCPRHGNYTEWSSFSFPCSRTCGRGVQTRTRTCTNPPPAPGGINCTHLGPSQQNRSCNIHPCPINGGYSEWSEWGVCSVTCDKGLRRRTRKCNKPVPQHGGRDCNLLGPWEDFKTCNRTKCKDIAIGVLLIFPGEEWDIDLYRKNSIKYRALKAKITKNIRKIYKKSTLNQIKYESCDDYKHLKTQCYVTLHFLTSEYQGILELQKVLDRRRFHDGMEVEAQLYSSIDVEVAKAVTGLRVLSTGTRSLHIQWKMFTERSTTRRIVGYMITYFDPQNRRWMEYVHGHNKTYTELKNLRIWTRYCVYISTVNERGIGLAAPMVCNRTSQDVPDEAPSNVSVESINATSVLVTWQPIPQEHIHGRLLGYHIRYRAVGSSRWGCRNHTDPSTNNLQLSGLKIYSTYKFSVAAVNQIGMGLLSEEIEGRTQEYVPSKAPRVSILRNTSSTSIYLAWEPISERFINGHLLGYQIFYQLADATDTSEWNNQTVGATANDTTITNLQKFTKYALQVAGFTRIGTGVVSKAKIVTTDEDVPSAFPTQLQAANVTNSTETLMFVWQPIPVEKRHGIVLGYKILYRKINESIFITKTVNSNSVALQLTKLRKFTKYEVRILAFTVKGDGPRSQLRTFLTSEDVPSQPPMFIDLYNTSSTSIRISWQQLAPEYIHGILRGYRVLYRLINETEDVYKSLTTQELSVDLRGLLMYTDYGIRVLAFTSVGDGITSEEHVCRTDQDVPSRPPEQVEAKNKSSPTTIPVFWKPISNSYYVHGKLLGYRVLYQALRNPNTKIYEEERVKTVDANTLSVVITELDSFTVYSIRVTAYTVKGNGASSPAIRAETCNCHKTMYTNWWPNNPYTNEVDSKLNGILPPLLLQATTQCCGVCADYNRTNIDFYHSGDETIPSRKTSEQEVKNHIEDHTELSFPLPGVTGQTGFLGTYGFVPLVKSAGAAFIVVAEDSGAAARKLVRSVFDLWPLFMSMLMSVVASGILLWFLDSCFNKDIPLSPFRGPMEGMWWAFVTMTTVGYGDRVPHGFHAKIFGLTWILCGLVIFALVMSFVTSSLTTEVMSTDILVYGTKIAAIQNSSEYRLGLRLMGQMDQGVIYRDLMDVYWALKNRKVKGALIDTYIVGSHQELFSDPSFRVNQIIPVRTEYGVVMAGDAIKLQRCFRNFLNEERVAVSNTIQNNVRPLTDLQQSSAQEKTKGLFDHEGELYVDTMMYVCSVIGGCVLLGILYEFCTRKTRNPNPKSYDFSNLKKDKIKYKRFTMYFESKKMMQKILEEFHKNCNQKIRSLKRKHERERRQLAKIKMEEHLQRYGETPSSTIIKLFGNKCEYKNGLLPNDKNGNAMSENV